MKSDLSAATELLNTGKKFAVGNDLVFIPAFQHSLTDLFKAKVYNIKRNSLLRIVDDSLLRYASTWAAKEAVYKAIEQLIVKGLGWKKIEIVRNKLAGRTTGYLAWV